MARLRRWLLLSVATATISVASVSAAYADPGTLIATTVLGLASGSVGAAAVGAAVDIAAAIGLSYIAKALAPKPDNPADAGPRPVKGVIRTGGTNPRSFVPGRWATAGSLVYANTWGENDKTPNQYLVQVIVLSDLPIKGLVEVWVDGRKTDFDPDDDQSNKGASVGDYEREGKENLWVRFHRGNQTVVDNYLDNHFGTDSERPWEDAIGAGVAYVVITARINDKLFSGFPTFKFVVDGVSLYDIREDSTAGGSGSQRWNDPSTWTFTKNPAVIIYNLLRGIHYDGKWFYGAQTVSGAQLPYASWAAAANECDSLVTNADSSTEPQFEAGGEILVSTEPFDEIEAFLKACNGRLAETGGIYRIHIGAAGSAVLSFTDDSILSTEGQTFTPLLTLDNTVNGISGTFVAPGSGWAEREAPPLINEDFVVEDGGRRNIADVRYEHVSGKRQVQRLMKAALAEARRARRHVIVLPPEAFVLEPLDFVSWTSTRNGYEDKLFRVDQVVDQANLDVTVYLTEVDPADYDYDASTDEFPIADGVLTFITPPSQAIQDWAAQGITIHGDGGRAKAGIRLSWDGDVTDVDRVDFEVRLAGGATIYQNNTPFVEAGAIDISQNIVSATDYEVRGQFQAISARPFSWTSWIAVTTPDVNVDNELSDQLLSEIALTVNQVDGSIHHALEVASELEERIAAGNLLFSVTEDARHQEVVTEAVAEVENRKAQVTQVLQAAVDGDKAQAEALLVVKAVADNAAAQVIVVSDALATATEATASQIIDIHAELDGHDAQFVSFTEALANEELARVTQYNVLTASIGDVSSDVFDLSEATTSALDSQATRILGVETSFNDFSASAGLKFQSGTIGGAITASILLYVHRAAFGDDAYAGMRMEVLNTGATRVVFSVDQFYLFAGGNRQALFYNDGGIIYMQAANIKDLTVTNLSATNFRLTTPYVQDKAINNIETVYTPGSASITNGDFNDPDHPETVLLATIHITVTGGKPVLIWANANANGSSGFTPGAANIGLELRRDGVAVNAYNHDGYPVYESLSAGDYTYTLHGTAWSSVGADNNFSATWNKRLLVVQEIKK